MSVLQDLKALLHPYYFFNIMFSVSFIVCKTIEPICKVVFAPNTMCELSMWESEVLFFLIVIVMFRTRKSGSRNFLAYLSTASMYAKTCNIVLWFSLDPIKGLLYVVLALVHFLLVGEPVYQGPENVIYFDAHGPAEELKSNRNTFWLIGFYASWSPACAKLAPVFSKLSLSYGLPNLKFGKVDVGRYPEVAKTYHINDTSFSLQLPTICLYRGDKELLRRPNLDSKGKYQKFFFTEDNIIAAYDLNNIYLECKKGIKEPVTSHAKEE